MTLPEPSPRVAALRDQLSAIKSADGQQRLIVLGEVVLGRPSQETAELWAAEQLAALYVKERRKYEEGD